MDALRAAARRWPPSLTPRRLSAWRRRRGRSRRAQQAAMPVIGFVRITTPEDSTYLVPAFRQGLSETGFVEGRNVTIEYRYAR
jgi:hypothetical protein